MHCRRLRRALIAGIVAALTLLGGAGSASAGSQVGKVMSISVRTNMVLFGLTNSPSNRAACGALYPSTWAIPFEFPTGVNPFAKGQLAALLSAQALGMTVTVQGMDTCTAWGGIEDAWDINVTR